jgi:hypothetical protein
MSGYGYWLTDGSVGGQGSEHKQAKKCSSSRRSVPIFELMDEMRGAGALGACSGTGPELS